MATYKDYYKILQVHPEADLDVIRAAFNRVAQKLHPDKNSAPNANAKIQELYEAYECLSDPSRRRQYDQERLERKRNEAGSNRAPPVKPKPVIRPSHILFNHMEPGQTKKTSFVIDNAGGQYTRLHVSSPNSWLKITSKRSFTTLNELPLEVKIKATSLDWGENGTEYIYIELDDVKVTLTAEIRVRERELDIDDFKDLFEDDPSQEYLTKGESYAAQEQWDEAIAEYTKAIELDPKLDVAYHKRGLAYYKKRNENKAIADFTRVIKLNPQYAEAYHERGRAFYRQGYHDKAIADWAKTIELKPKFAYSYYNCGLAFYYGKGDYDKATVDYTRAIKLDPKFTDAYYHRGLTHECKSDYVKAIADYTRAIKLNPQYARAYQHRGIAYGHERDFDKAIADLTKAKALWKHGWMDALHALFGETK